jgi:protein tyrosine/serine phosphatase
VTTSTDVRIPGAFNARVFGDAPVALLRSSALDALTPEGASRLNALGIRRVVDLREPGEGGAAAHAVEVVAVPVYGSALGVPSTGRIEHIVDRVLARRGDALARAVSAIAEADGPVAVHCTIGKDRTGIVVALALAVAGVAEDDIVADYVRSGAEVLPHRRAFVERVLAEGSFTTVEQEEAWRLNTQSPPEVMRYLLAQLTARGGAESYLRAHGMPAANVAPLRQRFATA